METIYHPRPGELGERVAVCEPSRSGPPEAWRNPAAAATCSITDPVGLPLGLNGIPFTHETLGDEDWKRLMKRYADRPEPPLPKTEKRLTSGLVIAEPDGRFWLVHPTNRFADVAATFPKGRLEPGLTLRVNAVKEAWEESGLVCDPVEYLCDIERTKTVTRYYWARRLAGSPADAGWESQAVSLVPASALLDFLNRPNDRRILPFIARRRLLE